MTIVYEGYGNALNTKIQTTTCPVNTVGVMGAGLALAMRTRISGLMDFYKYQCKEAYLTVDRPVVYKMPDHEDRQVLLFATKLHWKDDSELGYIRDGLQYIADHYKEMGITELALPAIGCGLGKLDYTKEVRPLIEEILGEECDLPVHILLRTE